MTENIIPRVLNEIEKAGYRIGGVHFSYDHQNIGLKWESIGLSMSVTCHGGPKALMLRDLSVEGIEPITGHRVKAIAMQSHMYGEALGVTQVLELMMQEVYDV